MEDSPFRLPSEMNSRKARAPLSTRVLIETKEALEKAAKAEGLSLGELVAQVLDDYAAWLKSKLKKR